ncbi:MAG: PEP/pyruvate-binding domain-containing protein, partial [Limisphaerales bacterium]
MRTGRTLHWCRAAGRFGVRAGDTVEDGADHSFAGPFESVLNVRGQDALLAAVKHCWLSLFSPRALAYHAQEHLPVEDTSLAVLVQKMAAAEVAGVLFTVHPVSGDPGRMVIEAVFG